MLLTPSISPSAFIGHFFINDSLLQANDNVGCEIIFIELSELVKQQMTVDYDMNGLKVHSCKTCNFTAKVTSNLRSHVEAKHMKDRMYQCIYCGETKKTWQTLQVHMKKDHEVHGFFPV